MTLQGVQSPEGSPAHGIFLVPVRAGQAFPGGTQTATKDEVQAVVACLVAAEGVKGGEKLERFHSATMQAAIDRLKAQAALFMHEVRTRKPPDFAVDFEGAVVTALCPGVRRVFELDMTAGGRRDGRLVKVGPAVEETGKQMMAPIFHSRHPRWPVQ
ncbi:hypothetical protein ABPG75_007435 [Micractinium tetrahymenae]